MKSCGQSRWRILNSAGDPWPILRGTEHSDSDASGFCCHAVWSEAAAPHYVDTNTHKHAATNQSQPCYILCTQCPLLHISGQCLHPKSGLVQESHKYL